MTQGAAAIDTVDVVDAAGAWADVVAGLAGVPRIGLVPMRRTIALVAMPERPGSRVPRPVRCRWCMRPTSGSTSNRRARAAGVPADETPVEPHDARPDELDVAPALERVEAVTGLGLRSVRTSWAGLRSFVADRRPGGRGLARPPGFPLRRRSGWVGH